MNTIHPILIRSRLGGSSYLTALLVLFTTLFATALTATATVVATPTFTPPAGSYNGSQSVTIATTTPGASIRYTVDGTTPSSTAGTLYSIPVVITSTQTLKAIAYASGMTNSAVQTGVYTIANTGGAALATAATYESISVVWGPTGGVATDPCSVQYRVYGSSTWQDGLDLWFDERSPAQYRGSIVGLQPGTKYEVKATLASGTTQTMTRDTMVDPANLPIGTVVTLPTTSSTTLNITSGGTANAYKLYQPASGQSATIDVAKLANTCITINAAYVIVRGVTCVGALHHGIQLGSSASHVIIEDCDISAWGTVDTDPNGHGFGTPYDSGVYSAASSAYYVTIQRNYIHHPSTDSNSWHELHRNPTYHPDGPQGITFYDANGGNHVLRYNVITSDSTHMFNDGMGGNNNFGTGGFPGQNSDVYGNIVTHCWDNPLEIEGGGRNIRVWGNYIDDSYKPIGVTTCNMGPLYVFRNVANRMLKAADGAFDSTSMIKAGSSSSYGDGRIYLFHNTMLQQPDGSGGTLGGVTGIEGRADATTTSLVSLNNIWFTRQSTDGAIYERPSAPSSGFKVSLYDYDLYNGTLNTTSTITPEVNGIHASPAFDSANGDMYDPFQGTLKFWLQSGTNGSNAGVRIKNFNDLYTGTAPDMGASESGVAMEFGLNAYLSGGSSARQ